MRSNRTVASAVHHGAKQLADPDAPHVLKSTSIERQNAIIRPENVQVSSPISPNSGPDTLYDVSSSSEERGGDFGSHGPMVGKRRKLKSAKGFEEAIYVYDDASLQRHIAAEVYVDSKDNEHVTGEWRPPSSQKEHGKYVFWAPGKGQARTTTQITSKPTKASLDEGASTAKTLTTPVAPNLQHSKGAKTNKQRISKNGVTKLMKVSRKPRGLGESSQTSFKRLKSTTEQTVQIARPRSKGSRENSSSSADAINQPQTPPHTLPKSFKSTSGTTTPRQRKLWGMLLKDEGRTSSPSILDLPNLKIVDPKVEKDLGYRPDKDTSKDATQPVPSMQRSRRRLMDNLQRVDAEEFISSDSSDEKSISDNDNGSNDGQFQAPTEILTFASEALENANTQARKPALPTVVQSLCQAGGLKVTYARQRSYLTEEGLGEAALFSIPITHETATNANHGRRRARAAVAEIEPMRNQHNEMDENECSQGSTMRSIHELRGAGGTVRLISEMETMLDDVDEQNTVSTTLRRSALLDLVVKLQDTSFCRLFVGQGLELRLLANIGASNDIIIDVLYAVAVLHLLVDPTSIQTLPRISAKNVISHLLRLLDNDQDLAQYLRDRKLNMSKLAQLDFKAFFGASLKSSNWRAGSPAKFTPRVLSLQCLEYLVRQTREAGSDADVLPPEAVKQVAMILRPTTARSTQVPAIALTADLQLAVSVLESCTLTKAALASDLVWTGETLDAVIDLLPLLVPSMDQAFGPLRTLLLRLYLNLTNNNAELCKAFTRPDLISAIFDIIISHFQHLSENTTNMQQPSILDNLILSLGSLINLAEWCDDLGHMVLHLRYGAATFLDSLLGIFVAKLEKAGEVRFALSYAST